MHEKYKNVFKKSGGDELHSPSLKLTDPAILFYQQYDNLIPTISLSETREFIQQMRTKEAQHFLALKQNDI